MRVGAFVKDRAELRRLALELGLCQRLQPFAVAVDLVDDRLYASPFTFVS